MADLANMLAELEEDKVLKFVADRLDAGDNPQQILAEARERVEARFDGSVRHLDQ